MKNYLKKSLLLIFTFLLFSCNKDDTNETNFTTEKSIIKYGIKESQLKSEPIFNDVKNQFVPTINSNNSKNNNTSFFDLEQDLINRLDLEKTHLNSIGNKQVLNAPIKTFGSYKRALLALKNNQHTSAYIITYPNPENDAVFYVATLQGKLLQKVTIQSNGIGLVEYFNDSNNNTSNKESQNTTYNSGCAETVYVTCSQGIHSFDLGNAHECYYWNNLSQGTPPRMFSIACDDSGGSGGNDNYDPNDNPFDTGSGNPNDNPYDGSNNDSSGGGFSTVPSQNGSNPDGINNCITNIDCPDCNLQNDINNDCNLDANEIMFNAFYNNSLNQQQQLFLDVNTSTKNNIFNYLVTQYFNQQALDFVIELIDTTILLNINAVEIWFNDYENFRLQMSNSERNIFDNLPTTKKMWYMVSAKKAIDKSVELFPTSSIPSNLHNGKGDAYRHALWNAYCTGFFGSTLAEQLTTAHEEKIDLNNPFPQKEIEMDLYNNDKGRIIGSYSSFNNVEENILDYLNIGGLRYLSFLDSNPPYYPTQQSTLIPTNQ